METKKTIESMFSAGAHFGLGRSRRHPTVAPLIFGVKNGTDIFDLEKTVTLLENAQEFIAKLAKENKVVFFIGGKKEASANIKAAADSLNMPYVNGRFIGGTLTNFGNIRRRVERYEKLISDREKGELLKYTKRERSLIDKEIAKLEKMFLGVVSLKKIPDALFVIDPRREKNAIKEANDMGVPVIALSGSDCDVREVKYPIVGNDSSKASIQFFVEAVAAAYKKAKVA